MPSDAFRPLEYLHVAVRRSFEKAVSSRAPQGVLDNLEILLRKLQQIRAFEDTASPRRIGVFGSPKRGKSTLLNELLGAAILTTAPIPMTRTVIEAHRTEASSLKAEWQVEIIHDDDFIITFDHNTPKEVAATIQQYGSHRGGVEVKKIIVRNPFSKSKLLEQNGILIDTPGAETAFEKTGQLDQNRREDTQRAVGMLKDVHVVLFCVRADTIGEESDRVFYQDHMRLLDPINIVNFKDKRSNGDAALIQETVKYYGFRRDRIYLVSSLNAENAKDSEEKDASGLPMLENAVLMELQKLASYENIDFCIETFGSVLKSQAIKKVDIFPEKVHLQKFFRSVNLFPSETTQAAVNKFQEIASKFN